MIKLEDILNSVRDAIGQNFINTNIILNNDQLGKSDFKIVLNNNSTESYVDFIKRSITIRIYYCADKENYYEIFNVQEKLETIFDNKLKVLDRYFNIDEVETVITDGVLQFYFDIEYEEGKEYEEAENMENLYIKE